MQEPASSELPWGQHLRRGLATEPFLRNGLQGCRASVPSAAGTRPALTAASRECRRFLNNAKSPICRMLHPSVCHHDLGIISMKHIRACCNSRAGPENHIECFAFCLVVVKKPAGIYILHVYYHAFTHTLMFKNSFSLAGLASFEVCKYLTHEPQSWRKDPALLLPEPAPLAFKCFPKGGCHMKEMLPCSISAQLHLSKYLS